MYFKGKFSAFFNDVPPLPHPCTLNSWQGYSVVLAF